MRLLRVLGNFALWLGACVGIVAGGVWLGGQFGWIQPLVVISGSMEPGIGTGDLIIDRWTPTANVAVGDVLSLESELTGKLVTHRVIEITHRDATSWQIRMKGDANAERDVEPYVVGDDVLTPMLRVPAGGKVVSKLMEPAVAMPVLLALIALLGLSLLDEPQRKVVRRVLAKVALRDPRVDELDEELAAVGIDVERLQEMSDLDLHLYSLGIEVDAHSEHDRRASTISTTVNERGFDDGLWDFELPPSDVIGYVHTPNADPLVLAGDSHADVDRLTPTRSG